MFEGFFGSLVSGASSLLGGILGSDRTAQANRDAINANTFNQMGGNLRPYLANLRDAAVNAGYNPLSVLGVNPGGGPASPAGDPGASLAAGISGAGQSIDRAISAYADKNSREALLRQKLVESEIASNEADVVGKQLRNSQLAVGMGAVGTSKGVNVPMPPSDPRGPVINMMQRARMPNGEIVWIPSEKAASPLQTMGALPVNVGIATGSAAGGIMDTVKSDWDTVTGAVKRAVGSGGWIPY